MKILICAIIILCTVIFSTVFVAICSNKLLSDFSETVKAIPNEEAVNINVIKSDYQKLKPFLILFMRDKDIEQTEIYIEDVINAAASDNKYELAAAKSRLQLHIEQLRRQSVFSIDAIF